MTNARKSTLSQTKKKSAGNKTRLFKQSAKKVLWLIISGAGVLGVWLTLATVLGVLLQPKAKNELILLLGYSVITLVFLMGLFIQKYKGDFRLIYRWTGSALLILITPVLIISALVVVSINSFDTEPKDYSSTNAISGNQGYVAPEKIKVDELLNETNAARIINGKPSLALNTMLNSSAQAKCIDMVNKNYWSHNDKNGVEPWHFITDTGYKYNTSGENLAYGFTTEKNVLTGWMNSPGHKENILNASFKEIGFGICESPNYVGTGKQTIVVQHFGEPTTGAVAPTSYKEPTIYKAYVASVCTKIPIPYKTVYIDASYMYVGENKEYGGVDGYTNTCSADSTGYKPTDYTIQPYDKTIYRGTKPVQQTTTNTNPPN